MKLNNIFIFPLIFVLCINSAAADDPFEDYNRKIGLSMNFLMIILRNQQLKFTRLLHLTLWK